MNTLQTQENQDFIERSRDTILSLGYDLIVFKSKAKKSLITLKKQITSFHP